MKRIFVLLLPAALLAGCVTTGKTTASADERRACEQMASTMGTTTTHDHGQMKGNPPNPMNLTHERCQQVLAQGK